MTLIVDFPQRASPQQIKRRHNASFSDTSQLKVVENLTCEYKSDLWYSDVEMDSFKYETALLLKKIKSVMTVAQFAELNVQNTSRFMGLENHLTEQGCLRVVQRRKAICKAVLSEQDRQRREGISYDPDSMSKVAQAESELSRTRAFVIGLIHSQKDTDEKVAESTR